MITGAGEIQSLQDAAVEAQVLAPCVTLGAVPRHESNVLEHGEVVGECVAFESREPTQITDAGIGVRQCIHDLESVRFAERGVDGYALVKVHASTVTLNRI